MNDGLNGSRPTPPPGLREQIAEDRRELAKTVTALRDKTDVKRRVQEKVADAEIAAAGAAEWAGRKADLLPRLAHSITVTAAAQARRRIPPSVRAPAGRAAGMVRHRIGTAATAGSAVLALLALLAVRWRRHRC